MANANSPFGLRPVRHQTGGRVLTNTYPIASGYNAGDYAGIYFGDVVRVGTDGNLALSVPATDVDNLGVFQGCNYVDSTGSQKFSK